MSDFVLARNIYRSSGGIKWFRFLILSLLTCSVAAGLAATLPPLAHQIKKAPPVLYPIVAHLAVIGLIVLTVALAHCRSPVAATALGIIVALIVALGPSYLHMMTAIGWRHAHRFDLLPGFTINHRVIDPDTGRQVFAPGVGEGRDEDDFIPLAVEAAMAIFLLPFFAARRASRVYCEQCGRWSKHEISFFPPEATGALAEAIETGDWGATSALRSINSVGSQQRRYAAAALEWCQNPADGTVTSCPIYFTAREIFYGGGLGVSTQYDHAVGRVIIRPSEIEIDELFEMTHLFPALKQLSRIASATSSPPAGKALAACTDVRPVSDNTAGRIMSKGAIAMGNLVALLPLLAMFACIGLAVLFGWWASVGRTEGLGNFRFPIALAVTLAICAFLVAIVIGIVTLRNVSALPNRLLRRRAHGIIEFRPDAIVLANDAQAVFVEIVPRAHWGRAMLETATDIGFLIVDERRRELRFEGDRERYRIPTGSIVAIDVECTGGDIPHFMIVLELSGPQEPWELSFTPRATGIFVPKNHRELAARQLSGRIAALARLQPPAGIWS